MTNEILMNCPDCRNQLELLARGKQKRLFGCSHCSSDGENPTLWFQPTIMLKALRKLEQGPLVEVINRPGAGTATPGLSKKSE